jgi:hypothetical protein
MKRLSAAVLAVLIILGPVYLSRAADINLGVEITEIMYDTPPPGYEYGGEWIEIYNDTGAPLNIVGWEIFDGSNWRAISQVDSYGDISNIPPGSYAVICEKAGASGDFVKLYDGDPFPAFSTSYYLGRVSYDLGFSATGENIQLRDVSQTIHQNFNYPDNATDASLVKVVIRSSEDESSNWTQSTVTSGSPGEAGADQSLPVTLTSFTASVGDGEVTLRWVTESEVNNLGFNIYRARREGKEDEQEEPKEDEYVKINSELIPGAGTSTVRHSYCFTDKNVDNGTTYFYRLEDVSLDGKSTFHGPVEVVPRAEQKEQGEELPRQPRLEQNFPNPFNPETSIRFAVPLLRGEPAIFLEIYNLSGQKVRTLLQQSIYPGFYQLVWDSRDQNGVQVASGVYLCVLKIGRELIDTRKMALIR